MFNVTHNPSTFIIGASYARPRARVEHGVDVLVVMTAGSRGDSGVRSDVFFALID
jgi:hypothetical protein